MDCRDVTLPTTLSQKSVLLTRMFLSPYSELSNLSSDCNNQTFAFLCSPDIKKCIVLNKILIPKMEMGNWSNLKEKIRQPLTPLHASGARDSLLPLLGTQPVLPAPVPVLFRQYSAVQYQCSVPLATIASTIITLLVILIITQSILPVPVLLRTQPTLSV